MDDKPTFIEADPPREDRMAGARAARQKQAQERAAALAASKAGEADLEGLGRILDQHEMALATRRDDEMKALALALRAWAHPLPAQSAAAITAPSSSGPVFVRAAYRRGAKKVHIDSRDLHGRDPSSNSEKFAEGDIIPARDAATAQRLIAAGLAVGQ